MIGGAGLMALALMQAEREKRRKEEEEQQRRMDELAARQRAREEEIEKRLKEEKAAALSQPPLRAEESSDRASRPAPSAGGGECHARGRWEGLTGVSRGCAGWLLPATAAGSGV